MSPALSADISICYKLFIYNKFFSIFEIIIGHLLPKKKIEEKISFMDSRITFDQDTGGKQRAGMLGPASPYSVCLVNTLHHSNLMKACFCKWKNTLKRRLRLTRNGKLLKCFAAYKDCFLVYLT